jgi:hypothetical protein
MITQLPPAAITNLTGLSLGIGVNLNLTQTATDVTIDPEGGNGVTIPMATSTLAGMLDAVRAATIDALPGSYNDLSDLPDRSAILSMLFDGGGSAIVAPITRYLYMPFNATITGYALLADVSGSVTVDVWKEPVSGYPPLVANSITGGNPMTLASAQSGVVTNIPSWTTTILAGDVLAFNLSANTSIKTLTAQLFITH